MQTNIFDLKVEEGQDEISLLKFKGLDHYLEPISIPENKKAFSIGFLDTETTSLDTDNCEIIEFAMIVVKVNAQGDIYHISDKICQQEQPSAPLDPVIKRKTGLTDEALKGKKINWEEINSIAQGCHVFSAFNAQFDRPICERYSDVFKNKPWACALRDIEWDELYNTVGKLEWLLMKTKMLYFKAHTALADTEALVHLVNQKDPVHNINLIKHLMNRASTSDTLIRAVGAPFEIKDDLKKIGYRWDDGSSGKRKAWFKAVKPENLDEEIAIIKGMGCPDPITEQLSPIQRYSK